MNRIVLSLYERKVLLKTPRSLLKNFDILIKISQNYPSFERKIDLCVLSSNRNVFLLKRGVVELRYRDDPLKTSVFFGRSLRNFFATDVKNFFVVHGGAVERNGKAVLFLGKHASGKSTLVREFCKSSWNYISDDILFIDQEFRVFPVPPVSTNVRFSSIGRPSKIEAAFRVKFSSSPSVIETIESYCVLLYVVENMLNSNALDERVFSILTKNIRSIKTFQTLHSNANDVLKFCEDVLGL